MSSAQCESLGTTLISTRTQTLLCSQCGTHHGRCILDGSHSLTAMTLLIEMRSDAIGSLTCCRNHGPMARSCRNNCCRAARAALTNGKLRCTGHPRAANRHERVTSAGEKQPTRNCWRRQTIFPQTIRRQKLKIWTGPHYVDKACLRGQKNAPVGSDRRS